MKNLKNTTTKTFKTLLLLGLMLNFLHHDAMAQSRAERRAAQAQQEKALKAEIAQIIESGNFSLRLVHIPAQNSNLSGGSGVLQEQRTITIRNDSIFGELPFQGSSTVSSYQSSSGGGFRFNDPIQTGTIKQRSRNYVASLLVNHPGESLDITIEIDFKGSVSMIIRSSRRSRASYLGVLQPGENR